jgi:hypothetical protein
MVRHSIKGLVAALVVTLAACSGVPESYEDVGSVSSPVVSATGPLHIGHSQLNNPCGPAIYCTPAPSMTYTAHDATHALVSGATIHATGVCRSTICGSCPGTVKQLKCRTDSAGQCTIKSNCDGYASWTISVDDIVLDALDYDPAANHN